jgi:hypothetical protein
MGRYKQTPGAFQGKIRSRQKEMLYLFVCIGVAAALKLAAGISRKKRHTLFYQSYTLRDGFNVTKAEWDEARRLLNRDFCSNEYCKKEIVTLFIDVKRHLAKEKRMKDCFASGEAILQYCKKAALDIVDFQDPVPCAGSVGGKEIPADIAKLIKERATEIVRPLTKESDRSVYAGGDAWKVRYNQLVNGFKPESVAAFYEDIGQLGAMSDKRITIERDIYYKAHQFLIHKDKEYSLKLYLHYLHVKTLASSFKHKKINRANSQWLFRNLKEEQQFYQVCAKLLRNNDMKAALKQVDSLGITQRKKIRLDSASIREAAGKQARIAGILSDLLVDEPESAPNVLPDADYTEALLQLFIDRNYTLNKEEADLFARSKGLFTSQLIQRINEAHFDQLDDVLIEEESEQYALNKTYLQQIREDEYKN